MVSSQTHLVVYVTAPAQVAGNLARVVVEAKLAACATLIEAVRSVYRWQGEICDEQREVLLVIKTQKTLLEALEHLILQHHPYQVPEIIALPLIAGHAPYLAWIDEATTEV